MLKTRLQGHTLFQMLHPEQLRAISDAAEEVRLDAGAAVYHQGDPADHLYVVLEGGVSLRGEWVGGIGMHVDEVGPGEIFGACICLGRDSARCERPTRLLRIRAEALKELLDSDLRLGYSVQGYISSVYVRRFVETVTKLQAIVHSLPLAAP